MGQTLDEIKQLFGSDLFEAKRDSFILKWALLNGKYDILNIFEKEAWTDDNIKLFLKLDMQIPKGLFSNSAVLKYFLEEKNFKYIDSFSDEAWDDNNIELFEKYVVEGYIKEDMIPIKLTYYPSVLKFFLNNGLVDYAYKMNKLSFDNDNEDIVLQLIDKNVIKKIPKGLIESSDFLKKILDRGYYDLVKAFNRKAWNSSNSVEYIESFEDENDIIIYEEIKWSRDFLLSLILMEKIEKTPLFYELAWKDGVADMLFMAISNINGNMELFADLSEKYKSIDDENIKRKFRNYIIKNKVDTSEVDIIIEIIKNVEYSNSYALKNVKERVIDLVLSSEKPLETFKRMEQIFLSKELPEFAKTYSVFRLFHTDEIGKFKYNLYDEYASPVLKKHKSFSEAIIFSDLIKIYLGSNNRSLKEYLVELKKGDELLKKYLNQNKNLNKEDLISLKTYIKCLTSLYNQTLKGKNDRYILKGNIKEDIDNLMQLFKLQKSDSEILDRVIRMYGNYIGITSYDEMIKYMEEKVKKADERGRIYEQQSFSLNNGDFIKGIRELKYLPYMINNGCASSEYLGESATVSGDTTPLDTDGSLIDESVSIEELFKKDLCAFDFGNTWLVLKNDEKFRVSRDNDETEKSNYNLNKLELFYREVLGKDHYAIRTGFASTDIDYIITKEYSPFIGYEIAKGGFYIPVIDEKGKILFTSKMYDDIRSQMRGLSHYGADEFKFSNNLMFNDVENVIESMKNIEKDDKTIQIKKIVQNALKPFNIRQKNQLDGDLSRGYYELISIGSNSRGTSSDSSDYDFIILLDGEIIKDENLMNEICLSIRNSLNKNNLNELDRIAYDYDFRFKNVLIDSSKVDIDISFQQRCDKITYSSDMAVSEKLKSAIKMSEEKTILLKANIIEAKNVLKKAGIYKTGEYDGEYGIGGIGVENWILSHGGSIIDAFTSFIEVYNEVKDSENTFEEFIKRYQIWDFGRDFFSLKEENYEPTEFISKYMNTDSLNKMAKVINKYLTKEKKPHYTM